MLTYGAPIPRTQSDIKQQQKLDRIRQCENLRKERLFNAKNRLIGKDNEALERQIAEKKLIKKLENEKEEAFFKKSMADIQVANEFQRTTDNVRKQIARDIDLYRLNEQQKHNSREYDLNDPKRISKQMPMRLPDITDPRELTMTSYLRFTSEDENGEKKKALKKHLWQGLAKQITENVANKKNFEHANIQLGKDVMLLDSTVNKAIEREELVKAHLAKLTMEYNLHKADYEREKKKLDKRKEFEDEVAHVTNCLTSEFYLEDPSMAKSSLGLHKTIGYNYKGMSSEELNEIKQTQLKQIEEMKNRRNVEKATDKYWMDVEDLQTNVRCVRQSLEETKKKELSRKTLEENMKLAAEQALRREYMKKMATDNFPTKEFFDAFNSTSR